MRTFNIFFLIPLLLSGCLSATNKHSSDSQNKLEAYDKTSAQLLTQNELEQLQVSIKVSPDKNNQYQVASSTATSNQLTTTGELKNVSYEQKKLALPNNAKPGECYAQVQIPAQYRTETKKVLIHEATHTFEKIPAQYVWDEKQVLIKEASETITTIPAKYDWKPISVLVEKASVQLKTTPAVYEDRTTKVLVKEAYTKWKKGHDPIEKISNSTDEIMCLIEVPAKYKTVTKRIMVTPEKTEKIMVPAVYRDGIRQVVIKPEEKIKKTVPAEYKTVKVKTVTVPAQQRQIEVPAVYNEAIERIKISDMYYEWRKILCETNTTPDVIYKLQNALQESGYNPGKSDGIIGKQTMKSVQRYQQEKELAVGQITIETLRSLDVVH